MSKPTGIGWCDECDEFAVAESPFAWCFNHAAETEHWVRTWVIPEMRT